MFQFKSFLSEEKEIAVKCCESTNKEEYLDSVLTFLYACLNLNVFYELIKKNLALLKLSLDNMNQKTSNASKLIYNF